MSSFGAFGGMSTSMFTILYRIDSDWETPSSLKESHFPEGACADFSPSHRPLVAFEQFLGVKFQRDEERRRRVFSSQSSENSYVELIHDKPTPCKIRSALEEKGLALEAPVLQMMLQIRF